MNASLQSHQPVHYRIIYHGSKPLTLACTIFSLLGLISLVWQIIQHPTNQTLMTSAIIFGLLTSASLLTMVFCSIKNYAGRFTMFFLISTFLLLIVMRLSALAGWNASVLIYTAALACKVMNYVVTAYNDLIAARQQPDTQLKHNTGYEWQLLFIRLFIGFDLVPHFTEKLFAGAAVRQADIHAFTALHVTHPTLFVFLAGIIEFAGCISLGCGFLTRLGSICLFIYIMAASQMGEHFHKGFIWASPGGGWEYPVLWSTLVLSFAVFGANSFSLDAVICDRLRCPTWVKHIMGTKHR